MITKEKHLEAQKIVQAYKLQMLQKDNSHTGKWKCMLCGRDKFTHKRAHKCTGGFRKRNIIWKEIV